jgi:hypothetical protein
VYPDRAADPADLQEQFDHLGFGGEHLTELVNL